MTGSSVLPVSIHKNQLYFLFGKENSKEDSAKGFSDFGGSIEKGGSVHNTAMREGAEELTGFLGNSKQIEKHIKKHGGTLDFHIEQYHTHVFCMKYDPNLPKYYNNNHRFLWDNMDKDYLNKTKLFEKIEIQWFTPEQMMKRIKEFRGFYQEMIKQLYKEKGKIKRFIQSCSSKKTRNKKMRLLRRSTKKNQ